MSYTYTNTEITKQAEAIDAVANFASRTIRFDENFDKYIIEDKHSGEEIGRYDTYRQARTGGH